MRFAILFTILALSTLSGCTTLVSTMLHRDESDNFYKNQNLPLKGVPMALKVPTHLDVWIEETYYLQMTPRGLEEYLPERRNLGITTTPVMTKKIFTVDFKRPAAGSLAYDMGFNEDQYLNKVANKIEDKTISDVTAAVQRVATAFAKPTAANFGSDDLKNKIIEGARHVAFRRFDIDAPDFEQQLATFVYDHMNACHDCGGPKKPPRYEDIGRIIPGASRGTPWQPRAPWSAVHGEGVERIPPVTAVVVADTNTPLFYEDELVVVYGH